ncbi:unnamed protein product [Rotaria sordida]|uniref:Uncharacterized protein n=1 Tax=Rotaria sordida TaxID=392033 RepID=A0A814DE84_9BILA|nr:unnamed protein product [Rotaria sordida]CAF1001228.1 unnamed protein product [Rotaria sordida]
MQWLKLLMIISLLQLGTSNPIYSSKYDETLPSNTQQMTNNRYENAFFCVSLPYHHPISDHIIETFAFQHSMNHRSKMTMPYDIENRSS